MTTSFILAEALRERAAVIDRDLPNGLEDLDRSIGIMEQLVKEKADVVYYRRLLVEVLCDRGTKLWGLGLQRESTADASRAVEEAEKLVAGMGATAEDGKVLGRARELRARMRDEVGAESDATSE